MASYQEEVGAAAGGPDGGPAPAALGADATFIHAAVALAWLDEAGTVLAANARLGQLLALPAATMVGQAWSSFIYPADRSLLGPWWQEQLAGAAALADLTLRGQTPAGPLVHLRLAVAVTPSACLLTVVDQRPVQQAQAHRELLTRSIGIGLLVFRVADGALLEVNDGLCHLLGYPRADLLTRRLRDLEVPEDARASQLHLAAIQGNGENHFTTRLRSREGRLIPVQVHARCAAGEDVITASVEDLTVRQAAEAQQSLLTTAIEQASETVVITDPDGTIRYANPAFERISGYMRAESVGQNPRVLKSGVHDAEFYRQLWATLHAGQIWRGHFTNRRKDGTLYEEEAAISPVRDAHGTLIAYVAVKRDTSREQQLESDLRQAQKMEAIGTLAGGIAHDFNNLLTVICGFLELTLMDLPPGERITTYLKEAKSAADRATDLVRQILVFSRKSEDQRALLDPVPLVKEVLKFLRASLPATIEIQTTIHPLDGQVRAVPSHIHQVVMNLCTNARQAIGANGGVIGVTVDAVVLDPARDDVPARLAAGRYFRLVVADNGPGIAPEHLSRIFDPYFTTKPKGQGTGLGLAVVHGIAMSGGGHVTVTSSLGHGAVFTVYLPLEVEAPLGHEATAGRLPVRGQGRVLVVDDEAPIIELTQGLLAQLGYEVVGHTDPRAALAWLAAAPAAELPDVVLTDLTMPGLTGVELARQIHTLHPALPIVLWSGFNEQVAMDDLRLVGVRGFVKKPFTAFRLAATLKAAMAGGASDELNDSRLLK